MLKDSFKNFCAIFLCALGFFAFTLAAMVIPGFTILFLVGASAFISYLYLVRGRIKGIAAAAAVSAILFAVLRNAQVLAICAGGIIPGIVTAELVLRKTDYYKTLIISCISFAFVFMGFVSLAAYFSGGLDTIFKNTTKLISSAVNEAFSGAPKEYDAVKEYLIETVKQTVALIKALLPSILIVFAIVSGYVLNVILRVFTRHTNKSKYPYVTFDMHRAPRHISYAYLICTVLIFFAGEGFLKFAASNIVAVLDLILGFCGLSFIEYKFKTKLKYGILRALVYIGGIIVLNTISLSLLSIAGMFDSFIPLRDIRRSGD